jgi:hypothetical protein
VVSIDLGSSIFKLPRPSNGASKLFGDENPRSEGYDDDTCPSRVYWQSATGQVSKDKLHNFFQMQYLAKKCKKNLFSFFPLDDHCPNFFVAQGWNLGLVLNPKPRKLSLLANPS